MNVRRKGSYLSVCFKVRDIQWILERDWEKRGVTDDARLSEFKQELYNNLAAQVATVWANAGWEAFRAFVADQIAPLLSSDQHILPEHIDDEFWERVNVLYEVSLTCTVVELFNCPFNDLLAGLLDALRGVVSGEQEAEESSWETTVHTLYPDVKLLVEVSLGRCAVLHLFGTSDLPPSFEVKWELELEKFSRLEYVLDPDVADLDEFE